MKRSIQDLDLKEGHKYLENQKIKKSGNHGILDRILTGVSIGVVIAGMVSYVGYTEKRKQLRKEVYHVSDTNHNDVLGNDEMVELGRKLGNISGNSYFDYFTRNNIVYIDKDKLEEKIDKAPLRVYKQFLNKYGNKKK